LDVRLPEEYLGLVQIFLGAEAAQFPVAAVRLPQALARLEIGPGQVGAGAEALAFVDGLGPPDKGLSVVARQRTVLTMHSHSFGEMAGGLLGVYNSGPSLFFTSRLGKNGKKAD
jgi:hypothetical protein